jgi:hypothetical protein
MWQAICHQASFRRYSTSEIGAISVDTVVHTLTFCCSCENAAGL